MTQLKLLSVYLSVHTVSWSRGRVRGGGCSRLSCAVMKTWALFMTDDNDSAVIDVW